LRTLQNHEVLRVGSLRPVTVDVRVIAATNRDLPALVSQKQFRADLYYRLSVLQIRVPTLNEREGDLPLLTRTLIEKCSNQYGKKIRGTTKRAEVALERFDWPGNIRELQSVIAHACLMAAGDRIDIHDLPRYIYSSDPMATATQKPADAVDSTLEAQEIRMLNDAMARAHGNLSQAARELCIGRDALRYRLKKYGLDQ